MPNELSQRAGELRTDGVSEDGMTFNVVAATERPIPMYDRERYAVIPEVLLMSGVQIPQDGKVPLLNSHSRERAEDVIGSASLRVEGDTLAGSLTIATAAAEIASRVKERHLQNVSIGYHVERKTHIPKGERITMGSRTFEGPVNVATAWRLRELSLTPIGADDAAKVRSLLKGEAMRKSTRAVLEARGLPADHDEVKTVLWLVERGMPKDATDLDSWVDDNLDKLPAPVERKAAESKQIPIPKGGDGTALIDPAHVNNIVEAAVRRTIEDQRTRDEAARKAHEEWSDACRNAIEFAGLPAEIHESVVRECKTRDELRTRILKEKADRQAKLNPWIGRIEVGAEQIDKHLGAMRTAFLFNVFSQARFSDAAMERYLPAAKRVAGWEDFRGFGFYKFAENHLLAGGVNTAMMTREEVAMAAWGFAHQVPSLRMSQRESAMHTTGSFINLTLDASNKTLLAAYSEYPSTWRICFQQGASVPDFKTIHRTRMSASPNLHHWPDNTEPESIAMTDEKESYSPEAYSNKTSFSYRLIVNDDMDALSKMPMKFGAAAARTVNDKMWAVITSNPTMSDAVALFATATGNRKKSNLTTGAGAPSVSTVQTLANLMMQMRGVNSAQGNSGDDILGLRPKYIVGPSALHTTIMQLTRSSADPAASGNSGIYNPASTLQPVIEPLLDASSTTAWYLIAGSEIDTVECTFLQGQETPWTRNWRDDNTLSQFYSVVQTFGVKAIDHRGMQKHAGA